MFTKFFEFMDRFGNKYAFLKDNFIWKNLRYYYWKVRALTYSNTAKPDENSTLFFTQNAEKINNIANILHDEQSKKEYLGIIKFRQTHNKNDFPSLAAGKKNQYFIDEVNLNKDEVFIDCGAYTGDTIDVFLKHCSDYKQIVAFEPDTKNFEKIKEKYGNNPKIKIINAGTYNKDGVVSFNNTAGALEGTIVDSDNQENHIKIQVKSIDNLNLEKVTFIKMDIEGAELNALKGAEKTILRDKPKLAISIYHSNEDMIDIAEYIYSIAPEYNFYVRHHMPFPYCVETVLYALP